MRNFQVGNELTGIITSDQHFRVNNVSYYPAAYIYIYIYIYTE